MAVDNSGLIAALQAAIGQGVTSVSYEGKSASYRSLNEMIQAVAYLQRQQDKANGVKRPVAGFSGFSNGYRTRLPGYDGCGW